MKPKKCKACKQEFTPARPLQCACSPGCALELVILARAREELKEKKAERRKDAQTRARLKTKPQLTKEAQSEFNKYIRLRDASLPCICCGEPLGSGELGGSYDAGHFRSVGSAPHLRFDEGNVHAQRKYCNRYKAGNAVGYRQGLIARLGLSHVEKLEADQEPRHFTREDLIAIRDEYRRKAKELEKCLTITEA